MEDKEIISKINNNDFMAHTYIIDRFEDKFAVCERDDLKFVNIEKDKLPGDAKEGDIITFDGKKYIIDQKKTKARIKDIEELKKDLWL